MKTCEKCGTELMDEVKYCPACGCKTPTKEADYQPNFDKAEKYVVFPHKSIGFNLHIIAIIAGILGAIIGFWSPIFGIIVALIGIVFSVIGKVLQPTHKYFIMGLLISIGGIVASIASWILGTMIFLMM